MIKLIEDLQSGDNFKIKASEQALSSYQLNNVSAFCTECCTIMCDPNVSIPSRQMTGTLLRRTILQNINNVIGWEHLPKEVKQQIKLSMAQLLASNERPVKRSAADNVSAICAVELPKNQWPNILNSLIQNVSHESIDIRQASLMALGFICQLMKQRGVFVSKDDTEGIFAGIVNGMKDSNPSINQLAIQAFINCLPTCQHVFNNQKVRVVVLNDLVNIVNGPDHQSKLVALQAISQMTKVVYFAMKLCIEPLVNFTLPIIVNVTNPELSKGAMEIWSSFLQQYLEQSVNGETENYVKTDVAKSLSQAFMTNMTIVEDDQEQGSIRGAAYRALCHLGQTNSNDIYQLVMNFVSLTIADKDWKKRQASIKAFSSLVEGLEHQTVIKLTCNALIQFLRLLEDNSSIVQQSAAFSLGKIAQRAPEAFLTHIDSQRIIKLLITCLGKKPEISKDICNIFSSLFGSPSFKTSKISVNQLDELLSAFFKNGMRIDISDGSLAGSSFLAAFTLIAYIKNQSIGTKYIQIILQNFNKTFDIQDINIRQAIQSGILSVLQNCLNSVSSQNKMNPQIADSVYQLIVSYFMKISDVDANGFYVLADLTSILPPETPYIQNVWKYVMHALQKTQDAELFKATMILIGDLSRFNPAKFSPYVVIINDLLTLFSDPNFNNEFVGDLFLSCPNESQKHLDKVLDVLEKALGGCVFLLSSHFDYADKLRQHLVQAITAIIHSQTPEYRQNSHFVKIIPSVVQFCKVNNVPAAKPSISFMRNSMMLCFDIIQIFGRHGAQHFKDSYIQDTLKILQSHNKSGEQQDLLTFAKEVLKI